MTKAEFKTALIEISEASNKISENINKIGDALDDPLDYDIWDYLLEDLYGLIPASNMHPYITVDKLMQEYGELFDDESENIETE